MKTPAFLEKLKKYSLSSIIRVGCIVGLFLMLVILTIQGQSRWYIALALSLGLLAALCINFFVRKLAVKSAIYALEYILLMIYSVLFEAGMLSTIYSLILVDFYLNNSLKSNVVFGGLSYLSYVLSIVARAVLFDPGWASVAASLAVAVNELIIFSLVFTIANMLNAIVKKTAEAEKNLEAVYAREKKLQEANEYLKQAAKLEERNRIAKQIHDTTGHSITTIIMQTEAAKLLFDSDPPEAKRKIVSANLQAISALEELRKSVRVLSGEYTPFDLSASLEKAINETVEGTDIAIRAKTENLDVDENTAFFLYSSLKEGLNNGIRHGNSTAFLFELKKKDGKIFFLLSDNGKGAKDFKEGFGLRTMREGAEKLGGTASFITAEGEGMEIRIELPVREKGESHD